MQIEILKDVVSLVAGERARGIVDLLFGKKNVNEFLISKKLKLTINQTRNILYKLGDEGLVSFVRKKDSKKGGWYTYFWTLNLDKGLIKFRDKLIKDMDNFKQQINRKKTERFYHSSNCKMEFSEEVALANNYACPECGEILQLKDNSKEIVLLEKDLKKNEGMLQKVQEEIKILTEQEEKIKQRRLKFEEKKKKAERDAKIKKKNRERNKLKQKTAKKVKKSKKGKKRKR
ncbi:MAG: hypothetical protein AABX85_02655 [Nanoarchaeota archaeon]